MSSGDDNDRRNFLRITSESFSLELEGDPSFILETYDTVREDILRRLVDLIRDARALDEDDAPATLTEPIAAVGAFPRDKTDVTTSAAEVREVQDSSRLRAANAANYVWVYVTHEIYNKVYVVDLDSFSTSPLSRFLDGRRVRKLYINRDHQDLLGPILDRGKTLWSELTDEGRARLASSGE